ncbi:MAG: ABC transporter ATP-binding protein [Acidobacteriota bacterium]|nr:ABC transporter ATP-binding protein [Acidobacteriota bacterium]
MPSEPPPVVSLRQVSKKYRIYRRPSHKFLELFLGKRRRLHREFWALREIDLEVAPGTTLGIVGRNGSGKSTLLQLVAGIHRQTTGDLGVRGTVSALLELGSGFNPEFTGRENMLMAGAVMGFTKRQMEERQDDILEFARIGEFVDQPVKVYSTGMFMRLAFSVAVHVDPDILLVDEALAVGDLIFQHRCIQRIRHLRRLGKTILFVSHDLQAVTQFCDRAILLERGRMLEDGSPERVVQRYQALVAARQAGREGERLQWSGAGRDDRLRIVRTVPNVHNRYGDGGARIMGVLLHSPDGRVLNQAQIGEEVHLLISARMLKDLENPIVGFTVRDRMGVEITSSNTSYAGLDLPPAQTGDVLTVSFRFRIPELRPGSYSISIAVARGNIWEHTVEDWIDNAYILDLTSPGLVYGMMRWEVTPRFRRFRDGDSPQG